MKLHQESEDAKANRKSLKPQVERRRRERMNRSMESLKSLLLQKQEDTQRRVEKAEILERTVLFLQSTARGDRLGCGGGAQTHSFQDGVSSCLQRAAQFLGPQGKGLWPGAALDASFSARFARSDPEPTCVQSSTEVRSPTSSTSPLLLRKSSVSTLRMLINRSRLCKPALNVVQTRGESHRSPSTPPQLHKVASRATKQSPSQSHPASQALWRPWP
ncbi:transcription factor HES-7.1-B-like [Hippoglossus hippoglossus]|uniref:transcription factor HES-7.1-B-like n=1 Tax=Hippoglossus hippoglossus TaxID=8267 RepID=UPI00148C8E0A|nr:transcription factor HES-7.1-B-like [Hippoglossus hippoglossus]